MTGLVYLFGAYLAICYIWAIYLAVRLYTGKRLRQTLFGTYPATVDKQAAMEADPLMPTELTPQTDEPTHRKVAA